MGNSQGKPVELSGEVNLNHFRLLRVVGRGAFGKVRIVERKDTGLSFALKYIRKDEVVRSESVRNIIRERRMLEHVNHPFICNLRYSFQDIEYMYLVVDLMSGGDLRFHISRKTFTEEAVRFWIAELGCALRYIHSQGIIHRDVKPDNVLLDQDGHVHLTDFNVASDLIPGKVLTSKSGTLAYLAPEVYSGNGYDNRADWWSLGVTFYECIYNKRPFDGSSESSLSAQIMAANPRFPVTQPPVSVACMHAIKAALTADPKKRMGSTWASFTTNEFFSCIDFQMLERKELEPVFVPSAEKTNFDATYDLEELLLEEAPLEARARRQKPRERLKEDATDKEIREDELYRMIETDFRPFDYTVAALKKMSQSTSAADASAQAKAAGKGSSATGTTGGGSKSAPASSSAPINGAAEASTDSSPSQQQQAPPPRSADSKSGRETPGGSGSAGGSSPSQQHAQPQRRTERAARPAPLPAYPNTYTSPTAGLPRPGMIVESPTGGVQVTLDGKGSWSELARQDATLPADASAQGSGVGASGGGSGAAAGGSGKGGVLGFLSRKKGRANSPKPKERGVLGKEGARVVIG